MKYFGNCKTAEDVKQTFKDLAKKLHPDCGGDAEEFKVMMNEYSKVFNLLKNIHMSAKGERYEKESHETPEKFADIISKIIFFEDVKIEIIGSWIWVSGNTMAYKDQLKEAGFWWSNKKKAWYYNGETEKKRHYSVGYSLDQLRDMWTCQDVQTEERKKIG